MKKSYLIALLSLLFTLTARSQEQPFQVYALKFAESSYPFTVADWTKGGPKDQRLHISFSVWLIKAKGHTVLVDAGFLRNAPDAAEFKLVNYTRPDSVLLKLGIRAGDITDIIMSHPHWDHIGGLALFPNAHIWIQKEDYNDFVGSMWQKGNSNGGFSKDDVKMIVAQNLAGKVSLVNGDQRNILPGISVFTGSRHTFNSQYVLVNTGREKIILASDNIWTYYSLEHMVPPADGGTLDPAGYIKAMQRMKTLASNPGLIVPGHDAQVYSRFPVIAEGIVKVQ